MKILKLLEKISSLASRFMVLFVILIALIALIQPITFQWVVPRISILLGVVMFGMGMTLRVEDFRLVFQRPKDILAGVLAQFLIMPILALLLVKIFSLPPDLAIGVILVGTCPGGTASNVITYLARGDLALSVSLTMTTTILAPIVTPALTWILAGSWLEVSFSAMMLSIAQIVLLPIFLGIVINYFFRQFVQRIIKILPLVSVTAIILIVGGSVAVNSQRILETGLLVMCVVICHNLLGYTLGFIAAKILRMDAAKTRTLAIEVAMQNSGLATSLAMTHFGAAAAVPAVFFSVWHNISGSIAANYLSNRNKP